MSGRARARHWREGASIKKGAQLSGINFFFIRVHRYCLVSLKIVHACVIFYACGTMPRNCCVPLCTTNASKNTQIRYHEFP